MFRFIHHHMLRSCICQTHVFKLKSGKLLNASAALLHLLFLNINDMADDRLSLYLIWQKDGAIKLQQSKCHKPFLQSYMTIAVTSSVFIKMNVSFQGVIIIPGRKNKIKKYFLIMHYDACCVYNRVCVQVQSFVRGRSVRKRRDKLKAEGRAQSVPRDEMLPCKVGTIPGCQVNNSIHN